MKFITNLSFSSLHIHTNKKNRIEIFIKFFTRLGSYWFTTTSKGKPRLICGGFGYTKHGALKYNEFHLWRCDHEKKASCRARAKMTDRGLSLKGLHNHPPPPLDYYKALASPSLLTNH